MLGTALAAASPFPVSKYPFAFQAKRYCPSRMIHLSTEKPFEALRVIGLATDRCHIIDGSIVRVHFRLSGSPPLGWSYTFTTVWQAVEYPHKRPAGVEGDFIWIDCIPEEVGAYHLERLEQAVTQANAEYRAKAVEQALNAERQAQLEAQLRSRLADLNRTLYPTNMPDSGADAKRQSWGSAFIATIWSLLGRGKRLKN